MRYGQMYGSGYGDPENHVAWFNLDEDDEFIYLTFEAAANFGNAYFSVFRNSKLVTRRYVPEETPTDVIRIAKEAGISNSVLILRDGLLADGNYLNIDLVRSFEEGNPRPMLRWTWPYFVAGPDDAQTSNWSLTGLLYSDTAPVNIFPNQTEVTFDITVATGVATVEVYVGQTLLLSGSGAVGGTVSLSGDDKSGSVDVDALAVTQLGRKVRLVWPDSMIMYRTDSGGTILSTLGTRTFNAQNTATIQETNDLTNGTYYYKGKLASAADDVDMSGFTAVASITITNSPAPVTNLAIAPGGTAASTSLTFTPSVTGGSTYRLYLQRIGEGRIDLYEIEATSSSSPITLPVITGFPGRVRALVRAVSGGNEDNYLTTINIDYDAAGDVIYARPNVPQIDVVGIRYSGGDLQIPVIYNPTGEEGVAVDVALYYRAQPGDSWTAFGTASLGNLVNGVRKATFDVSGLAADRYFFTVSAITAGASESDLSASTEAFELGSFTVTAPTLSIDLARN